MTTQYSSTAISILVLQKSNTDSILYDMVAIMVSYYSQFKRMNGAPEYKKLPSLLLYFFVSGLPFFMGQPALPGMRVGTDDGGKRKRRCDSFYPFGQQLSSTHYMTFLYKVVVYDLRRNLIQKTYHELIQLGLARPHVYSLTCTSMWQIYHQRQLNQNIWDFL